ncbi:MAG: porin family protein [bacterium]|nr:porin family protein [bacterium]
MNRTRTTIVVLLILMLCGSAWAGGRPDKSWKSWFGYFSLDYALAEGRFGDVFDDDVGLTGGALYQPEEWPIGINLELEWANHDVQNSILRDLNDQIPKGMGSIDNAEVDTFSVMAEAVWSPGNGPLYLTGGVGLTYWDAKVTEDQLVYYPPICDPWWWWCIPGGIGEGSVIVASEDATDFTWSAGIGVAFEVGSNGSQLFIEAKYQAVELNNEAIETIPISIGYRF